MWAELCVWIEGWVWGVGLMVAARSVLALFSMDDPAVVCGIDLQKDHGKGWRVGSNTKPLPPPLYGPQHEFVGLCTM